MYVAAGKSYGVTSAGRLQMAVAAALLTILSSFTTENSYAGDPVVRPSPNVQIYSGGGVSGRSWFVYAGGVGLLSGGLHGPGWRVRAMTGQGRYAYDNGDALIFGTVTLVEAMLGYQLVTGPLTLKLFAGPHHETHSLSQDDPGNNVRGSKTGAKAQLESWLNLGAQGFASADFSASSVHAGL